MRLLSLALENIGPFDRAELRFLDEPEDAVPVAFITGENGTGKSIVLDAIRGLFGPLFAKLERRIDRQGSSFIIEADALVEGARFRMKSTAFHDDGNGFRPESPEHAEIRDVPTRVSGALVDCPSWIVDFWRPGITAGEFDIQSINRPNPRSSFRNSLQGTLHNTEVTELICFFDYLRDSRSADERRAGDLLYETIAKIIAASVLDGGLDHVERATLTPIIRQSGQLVPISNLSAGNAYLIQRLVRLLGRMYAVHVLRQTPSEDLCNTPGLLLIDEAEIHLHPRWQKRFVRDILSVFPNLQIIATTHSPFILASTPGAKVFVCRYDREVGSCVIEQQHETYANKPIDEVVLSDAFDGTQPFGPEITALLEQRAAALEAGDEQTRRRVERELQQRNPQYFGFLDVEERLRVLGGGG